MLISKLTWMVWHVEINSMCRLKLKFISFVDHCKKSKQDVYKKILFSEKWKKENWISDTSQGIIKY